jgi:hypothetical protein
MVRPGGALVLIEGRWAGTHGEVGGLTATELSKIVSPHVAQFSVDTLTVDGDLWGRAVQDERYAIVAHR